MPKRTDIHKILVIGSGPIVIGQAAEFDYAGTQACLALKEEGYEVILVNSNPATIMTDTSIADKVYMEPLKLEYLAKILRYERPDAIVPGIGGQTGLNLAMQLEKKGVLRECQVELLGTSSTSIERAEDRELFKQLCQELGEPVLPSIIVHSIEEGLAAAHDIGYPVVLRPAFTLGGTGGGFAGDDEELRAIMKNALKLSPVGQVLVEKSIKGYKEIEYEVMRDKNDTAITICNMENVDPVGIHTGDSIVVAPSQTLTNKEYHLLRDSALRIIRALKIEGGCNVQFALDPESFSYYVIEVNPRVSRSSALASKASGYPIARVSAKIAVGMTLDEIRIANTPASFEPTLDYVVTKMARFPFDKFATASNKLSTQMKATGEVMSVGRTIEESFLKAVRSLEIGVCHLHMAKFDKTPDAALLQYVSIGTDDRIFAIAELLRRGVDEGTICNLTQIDMLFLDRVKAIVDYERVLRAHPGDRECLYTAKRMGFADKYIARLWGVSEEGIFETRREMGLFPVYKMIDTCASEFESYIPYFYATYEDENESIVEDRPKIVVLGSGPIRIGQGVEFDYSTVHAVKTIKETGYEAIIINNNPETVSTDYTTSDKLYFEPLTPEDVMNVIELEKPVGVVASLGGQTAINLAEPLLKHGVHMIGTDCGGDRAAENRDAFEKVMQSLGIPQPSGVAVTDIEDGVRGPQRSAIRCLCGQVTFSADGLCRLSAMRKCFGPISKRRGDRRGASRCLSISISAAASWRWTRCAMARMCSCPALWNMVERTGIHSGDSISVYPTFAVGVRQRDHSWSIRQSLGWHRHQRAIQYPVYRGQRGRGVVIEVNPRSSRTVPFVQGHGLAAGRHRHACMLGKCTQGAGDICPVSGGKEALVCKGAGILLLQTQRDGHLSLP